MSYTYFGNHQGDWTASASYRARDTVINNNALYRAKAPHTAGGTFVGDAAFWDKLSVTTEEIQDLVGAMVTGNTETGITVTYDDTGGKLDFSVSGGGGYSQEEIEDFVGAMVTGNTETGIAVTYDDASGKLNFSVDTQLTGEQIEDLVGAMVSGNSESGIAVTYDDTNAKLDFAVSGLLSTEDVQDIVGGMVSGNSETAISVTYDDSGGKLDFAVTPGSLDIDSFPAATTPIGSADLFIVSQSGTEGKVAYSDISTGSSTYYENRIDDPSIFATMYGTIDTGSSTEFDGSALTIPSPSGAAWLTQGGRTYLEDDGLGRIKSDPSTTTNNAAILWTKPAATFTIYAKIHPSLPMNYHGGGICIANSADRRLQHGPFYQPGIRTNLIQPDGTFDGDLASLDHDSSAVKYFKLYFTGTTVITSVSVDGEHFTVLYTNTGFAFASGPAGPNRIGICQYADNVGRDTWAIFEWFRVVL